MISICIPTYNTDCTGLLKSLNNQIKSLDTIIEIIVFDDGSTLHQISNKTVCSSMGFVHIENKENLGRVASRKKLAEMSKYQYLLFIAVRSGIAKTATPRCDSDVSSGEYR